MRPPPIVLLQILNALAGLGCMLVVMAANGQQTKANWHSWQIGMAISAAFLTYAVVVAIGGHLADHWGRARTSWCGGLIGVFAGVFAVAMPTPVVGMVASILGCAAIAFYYPGAAGLISDAESVGTAPTLPLHAKIGRYNLGWSCGNLSGFFATFLLANRPPRFAYAFATFAFLLVAVPLWWWRSLPPQPARAIGDRAPHPALPRLTLMARLSLLIASMLGMGMIGLVARALHESAGDPARGAGLITSTYALGYTAMFVLLGHWSGWVMRPWRTWALQLGFLLGALGLAVASAAPPGTLILASAGLILGVSYGAAYTASIYYSLRLPDGVGRALAWHETCIGVGNAIGPSLAGVFMSWCAVHARGTSQLFALSLFVAVGGIVCLLFQALLIPGIARKCYK